MIKSIITQALREDAAFHDITTNFLIPKDQQSTANILIKEEAIVCGLEIVKDVFKALDPNIQFKTLFKDGSRVKKNTVVAVVKAKTRALLSGERVALNFLGHLSGIATLTHQFVQKVKPSKVKILDTRKTTPGLRIFEKYAVRCGGGENHRGNLSEMILIKDNHRQVIGSLSKLQECIRNLRRKTKKMIEVEVDSLLELREVLKASPDIILLDNMSPSQVKKVVNFVKKEKRRSPELSVPTDNWQRTKQPLLEASGGITITNVSAFARTGVDRISIGSLTHSARAINVSMEMI